MTHDPRRGLSLIEMVIAVALLGILAVPAGLLVREVFFLAIGARDAVVATGLARAELESLRALNDFFASPELDLGTTAMPNYQGTRYTVTRTVTCAIGNCTSGNFGSRGAKRVQVMVTVPGGGAPLVTLWDLYTKHVTYGS